MSDLVERLVTTAGYGDELELRREAAAEIERLRARVAELDNSASVSDEEGAASVRRGSRLERERDALAAALRLVDEHASGCSSQIDIPDPLPRRPCDCYLKQVDAALAQHAPGGEDDA